MSYPRRHPVATGIAALSILSFWRPEALAALLLLPFALVAAWLAMSMLAGAADSLSDLLR